MVLDFLLWMAGGTTEGKIIEIIGIFEDFCGWTLASHRGL